jgi:hypothetical protein
MFNDPLVTAIVVLVGVTAYQAWKIWVLDQDIDNLMNAHNEFVNITQQNAAVFKDALLELAMSVDEVLDDDQDV